MQFFSCLGYLKKHCSCSHIFRTCRNLNQLVSDVLDSIATYILAKVLQEMDYRIDICRVKGLTSNTCRTILSREICILKINLLSSQSFDLFLSHSFWIILYFKFVKHFSSIIQRNNNSKHFILCLVTTTNAKNNFLCA